MNASEELKKRYCFLYENAALILGCFVNGFSLKGLILGNDEYKILRDEVRDKINFPYTRNCYNLEESDDFIYLIEDAFLGDKPLEECELFHIINDIKKEDKLFSNIKDKYRLDSSITRDEVHAFDVAFRVLLEVVRVFVNMQKSGITKVDDDIKTLYFYRKFDVLQRYYEIQRYRYYELKMIDDDLDYLRFNFTLPKIVDKSLVKDGSFLFDLASFKGNDDKRFSDLGITYLDKRKIYYKYHDIIPWDSVFVCSSDDDTPRPDISSSCGVTFAIREEDIFFYEECFYELCPFCGNIVKLDNSLIPEKIKLRIREKYKDDKDIFRKKYLLSELSFLDKDNKVLSKRKSTN